MTYPVSSTEDEVQNIKDSKYYGKIALKGRGQFNITILLFEKGVLHYRPSQDLPFEINNNSLSEEDADLWFKIYSHSDYWDKVEITRDSSSIAS